MREYLVRINPCLMADLFHLPPYVTPVHGLSAACDEYHTGYNVSLPCICLKKPAQSVGQEYGSYLSTYALSSTILPVVQECRVPVLLLNIQPTAAIDFKFVNGLDDRGRMTGEWLAYCQACSIPEFASVFNRSGIKYDIITGYLSDESMWKEIKDWLDAVRVVKGMRENRMGILGHYYTGMLDVYTDVTLQSAVFGTYIEQVEMCELAHYYESATEDDLQAKLNEFHEKFDVSPQCEEYELQRAARTSIALDKLVEAHRLGSLAYYYEGFPGNSYENLVTSVIAGNTLLTGRGIPVAGECEVKNVRSSDLHENHVPAGCRRLLFRTLYDRLFAGCSPVGA